MVFSDILTHKYSPVNDDEEQAEGEQSGRPRCFPPLQRIYIAMLLVFTYLLGGIVGFSLGAKGSSPEDVGSALKRK